MNQKNSDKKTLLWLLARVKGKKRYIVLLMGLNIVLALSSMCFALMLRGIVDHAAAGESHAFLRCCILLVSLVVAQFLMRMLVRHFEEYSRSEVENALKRQLFSKLLTGDYAAVTVTHSGEWLNRLTSDTVVVSDGVATILPGVTGMVVRMVSAMSLLVAFAPTFGLSFIIGGALVVGLTWGLRRLLKHYHQQMQSADGVLRVFLSERLGSLMILRAFEQEKAALAQGDELMRKHKAARMKKNHISNVFHSGFSFAVNCVYVFGAIYCGSRIMNGTMSYGTFTAVLQLISQAQMPIGNISGFFPKYSAMLASAERLMEAERYEPEPETAAVEDISAFYRDQFESIGLRDAGFTYLAAGDEENRPTVLKGLNLSIQKGEFVTICGPSGCGKSTVLKLLMSMYKLDEGSRFVSDREGEHPLNAAWRGLFAYVPQGNHLMSGTIREVVTFNAPQEEGQDERIHRALTIACAEQFVSELPMGLDTQLGERGAGLSEGQMQRIAIARAIFSQPPILLLDEATSSLDAETEKQVLENLRQMTDETVVIVTHRPAALAICDKRIELAGE